MRFYVMAEKTTTDAHESTNSTSFMTSGSESEYDDDSLSILDVLKAPSVATQNRKRKVLRNRGSGRKSRCSSSSSSGTVRVSPQQRLKDFQVNI